MSWKDYFDKSEWKYDISQARLPIDERPDLVVMTVTDERVGTYARVTTNRHLEGLFWADGTQEVGTGQFSLRDATDEEIIALLGKRLEACMMPAIESMAEKHDKEAYDAIVMRCVAERARAAEDLEFGVIWYEEQQVADCKAIEREENALCELALKALGD